MTTKLKSAEGWMEQFTGLHEPALVTVNRMAIREIQLNTLEAAVEIVRSYPDTDTPISDITEALFTQIVELKGKK
jgi:hypothetical protein